MINLSDTLLEIRNLSITFFTYLGISKVLDNVSLNIGSGEILGLVGETGCGKSVTARAILKLIPEPPGKITQGEVLFHGEDILKASKKRLRKIRGNSISMIFQEPMSSLNPVFTVGNQMREVLNLHQQMGQSRAHNIAVEMLRRVNISDPEKVIKKYPHELSGGMRQRVMIAMALSCQPDLLIADEPTTALDVTVQGQVLAIISELTRKNNVSVLFITHDMGVIAQLCDRVAVMYAGKIIEIATVRDIFSDSRHPYTRGLISVITGLEENRQTLPSIAGTVPNLVDPPGGCRYHPRCQESYTDCERAVPSLIPVGPEHFVACHVHGGRGDETS